MMNEAINVPVRGTGGLGKAVVTPPGTAHVHLRSERGRAAAASRLAVERIDAELERRVGADFIAHTRATLAALFDTGLDTRRATTPNRPEAATGTANSDDGQHTVDGGRQLG